MDHIPDHLKQTVIKEELDRLLQASYISQETYGEIMDAQFRYDQARNKKAHEAELLAQAKEEGMAAGTQSVHSKTDDRKQKKQQTVSVPQKPQQKQKRKLSEQEIRDRNITWLLGIGVVFLLIAGTFLATSTWYLLPDIAKTLVIAFVAALFFGLALLTDKVLTIRKTGFAFYVLGALFLPIVILSIGFYGQLGQYLSLEGEGKYLFGAMGSAVLLPIYLWMAQKLHARLFVWFGYVSATSLAGFFIGWLHLPIDGFYLGMVLFNTGLIFLYQYARKQEKWDFFTKDFVKYIQANLILTSVFVIFFYDHAMMNGLNLVITAVLYLMMVFVTNYRQYHYVFTLLFVYGAYQLIEYSGLHTMDALFYAILGFVFLLLPKLLPEGHGLTNVFQYTSVIISGLAFIFISFKAMVLTMDEASIVMVFAYLLIAFNFIYAANRFEVRGRLFSYISALFLMVALYEAVLVGQQQLGYEHISLPLFCMAFLAYVILGCLVNHSFLNVIKQATRDVSLVVMGMLTITYPLVGAFWETGLIFLLLSFVAVLAVRYEPRLVKSTHVATWLHGLLFGVAVLSFYHEWGLHTSLSKTYMPTSAAIAGLIVLGLSLVWRHWKRRDFFQHTFYLAPIFYFFGMLQTLEFGVDPWLRVLTFLVGIGMVYVLYRGTKLFFTPYLMGGTVLGFLLVTLYAIHQPFDLMQPLFLAFQFTIISVILFVLGYLCKEHLLFQKAFWWAGHLFLPFALLMEMFSTDETVLWAMVLTGIIYVISLRRTKNSLLQYIFLYQLLNTVALTVIYFITWIGADEALRYNLFITMTIYMVVWFLVSESWKKRLKYYLVPFSIMSVLFYSFIVSGNILIFSLTALLTAVISWLLMQVRWEIITVLPLGLFYTTLFAYSMPNRELTFGLLLAYAIILFTVGTLYFARFWQIRKKALPAIDWYTCIGFLSLLSLYPVTGEGIFEQILPDILLIIALFIQKYRVRPALSKWIVFAAAVYVLKPYYKLVGYFEIPDVIVTEFYVLPWVIVVGVWKKLAGEKYKNLMNYLQWAVLIIAAAILVTDALQRSTIYDALIIGTLSLVSMLLGMQLRINAYFFVGLFVLLLNVFLQTRPFWGNMPWWMYLLIVGTLLIVIASMNEWYKQRKNDGKVPVFIKRCKQIIDAVKSWE